MNKKRSTMFKTGRHHLLITLIGIITISSQLSTRSVSAIIQKGSSAVDQLRADYLLMDNSSWAIVENDINQRHVLRFIFDEYRQFVEDHMHGNFYGNEFPLLEPIYEWKLLEKDLMSVNSLFDNFRELLRQYGLDGGKLFDELAICDFAETVLNDRHWPVNDTLDQIENIMVKQGVYYKAQMEAKSQVCATRQSAQQVLYQLYSAISLTELKGYAMLQFSWMLLKTYGKGNYTRESQLMHQRFIERTEKTQLLLRKVMERSDRSVWRCDPQEHIEGETYEAVTRLLQGFIENEVDMNGDETCKENCAHYQYAESHGCFKDLYCSKQPKCTGRLLECQFVDSDMWICPAKLNSKRRYEFIEYENGRTLGKKGSCARGTTKVDSWWRWIFWHCSYCFCLCDEQGPKSDRYFNLRESVSNVTANRVVTGLRFVKRNRIIHLQIQEGELLPRGAINSTSVQWKPISEYKLLDRGIRNGQDYHTMTWDRRAIDLDDLLAPNGHVVTGVRFRMVGNHLNLELRITEVDFVNGKLVDPHQYSWISNDNTETSNERRTQVILRQPDVPTNSHSKSVPDSKTNQYIEMQQSDMEKDAAQTTVPFIDAQEVTSFPPVALAGAGLYHKGQDHYGGFVAPKLITFDFAPHIQTPKPVQQQQQQQQR